MHRLPVSEHGYRAEIAPVKRLLRSFSSHCQQALTLHRAFQRIAGHRIQPHREAPPRQRSAISSGLRSKQKSLFPGQTSPQAA